MFYMICFLTCSLNWGVFNSDVNSWNVILTYICRMSKLKKLISIIVVFLCTSLISPLALLLHQTMKLSKSMQFVLVTEYMLDLSCCSPQVTIATAIIFCHRFFHRQSHSRNDRRVSEFRSLSITYSSS